MMARLVAAVGLTTMLFSSQVSAATQQQKMETCTFGADDKKLTGTARKSFMAKCMSNKDSPRGKPVPSPKPR